MTKNSLQLMFGSASLKNAAILVTLTTVGASAIFAANPAIALTGNNATMTSVALTPPGTMAALTKTFAQPTGLTATANPAGIVVAQTNQMNPAFTKTTSTYAASIGIAAVKPNAASITANLATGADPNVNAQMWTTATYTGAQANFTAMAPAAPNNLISSMNTVTTAYNGSGANPNIVDDPYNANNPATAVVGQEVAKTSVYEGGNHLL